MKSLIAASYHKLTVSSKFDSRYWNIVISFFYIKVGHCHSKIFVSSTQSSLCQAWFFSCSHSRLSIASKKEIVATYTHITIGNFRNENTLGLDCFKREILNSVNIRIFKMISFCDMILITFDPNRKVGSSTRGNSYVYTENPLRSRKK